MEIKIRNMQVSEAAQVAQIHMDSFGKRSLGHSLGRLSIIQKLKWLAANENAITLVAAENGTVAGFVYGARRGYEFGLYKSLLPYLGWGLLTHPLFLLRKRIYLSVYYKIKSKLLGSKNKVLVNIQNPVLVLGAIAVSKEFEGRGIGSLLTNAYEREAIKQNYRSMLVTTAVHNQKAQNMYVKNGWSQIMNNGRYVFYYKSLPEQHMF